MKESAVIMHSSPFADQRFLSQSLNGEYKYAPYDPYGIEAMGDQTLIISFAARVSRSQGHVDHRSIIFTQGYVVENLDEMKIPGARGLLIRYAELLSIYQPVEDLYTSQLIGFFLFVFCKSGSTASTECLSSCDAHLQIMVGDKLLRRMCDRFQCPANLIHW